MKELSKEQIKERAKFLRQILREKHSIELPHGHALEVVAKVLGYNDWNTASALATATKPETETNAERPLTAKFQTTDEAAKFLLNFPKGTKLFVNEYSWVEPKSDNKEFMGAVTSVCSLTYDHEIQNESELRLELQTEHEHSEPIAKSATQTFDRTAAGRHQRRIKLDFLKSSFWNPRASVKSEHTS